MIKVLFFAQLREQLDCAEVALEVAPSTSIKGIKQLLAERGEQWQKAFGKNNLLSAINQNMVDDSALVQQGDEVAFFPPVTGG